MTRKLLRKRRANLNGPSGVDRGPAGPKDTKERDVQELLKNLQVNLIFFAKRHSLIKCWVLLVKTASFYV